MVKITAKLVNFSKCARSARKICNLYVTFDTCVEKRGHWMWTKEKRGVIGCKIGVTIKRGSIDRHLISTDIWECPPPPGGECVCAKIKNPRQEP